MNPIPATDFPNGNAGALIRPHRPSRNGAMVWYAVGSLLLSTGCADCLQIPCPRPTAVEAVVTSGTGLPITGLVVDVSTPTTARIPCDDASGRCTVPGSAGNYTLRFSAPGHQTLQRSVTVARVRAVGPCGCEGVTTQELQLTLVPLQA